MSNAGAGIFIVWLVFYIGCIVSWVANIFKLFGALSIHGMTASGEIILRLIGVPFFPIGVILGWF